MHAIRRYCASMIENKCNHWKPAHGADRSCPDDAEDAAPCRFHSGSSPSTYATIENIKIAFLPPREIPSTLSTFFKRFQSNSNQKNKSRSGASARAIPKPTLTAPRILLCRLPLARRVACGLETHLTKSHQIAPNRSDFETTSL